MIPPISNFLNSPRRERKWIRLSNNCCVSSSEERLMMRSALMML